MMMMMMMATNDSYKF